MVLVGLLLSMSITLTEQPHQTTTATVVINATPAEVYAATTDYAHWPQVLHDVTSARVLSGGPRDAKVRFRSTAFGHEIAVQFDNIPDRAIRFKGVDAPPGARATGVYVFEPVDGGAHTRVTATLYLDVVGAPGWFIRDSKKKALRDAKLRADLGDMAAHFPGA